jgi:hypothetical protein
MPTHSPLDIIYAQPGTHLKRTANLDIGFLRRSDVVALCSLFRIRNAETLLREVCLSGKGRVRPPFPGCTWIRFFQHLVDLLQGETFGLRHKEVRKGKTDTAETTPHEEDVRSKIGIALSSTHQIRCDGCDDLIEDVSQRELEKLLGRE